MIAHGAMAGFVEQVFMGMNSLLFANPAKVAIKLSIVKELANPSLWGRVVWENREAFGGKPKREVRGKGVIK